MGYNAIMTREEALLSIGFYSYSHYLGSPMWKAISSNALARANRKCACCGGFAFQVHHRAYDVETLRGKRPENLVPVCRDCHGAAEFIGTKKATLDQANDRTVKFSHPENFVPDRPSHHRKVKRRPNSPSGAPPVDVNDPQEIARTREARIDRQKKIQKVHSHNNASRPAHLNS